MSPLFAHLTEPLEYAQRFCTRYAALALTHESQQLANELVRTTCDLTGCELSQLYLLDATQKRLELTSQSLHGVVQPNTPDEAPADFSGEQLLHYSLHHNRILDIDDLNGCVYETRFLPDSLCGWQTLLCLPVVDPQERVAGLLICASSHRQALGLFMDSLRMLSLFVAAQLQLLRRSSAPRGPDPLPTQGKPIEVAYGLIGNSTAMQRTRALISRVLHSRHTVLLTGETGTGKEVVSRAIHEYGARRSKPFVVQNCAAFPESLLESELFGYRKGAFTGADRDRAGLFDTADGGTLMLDEIGDMPLFLQAKLLRVLQEGEIRPLGSNVTRKVDVRIIAATHQNLPSLIAEGRFREDLYYRLAQFPIELPSLRQRGADVAELARHFADQACHFLERDPLRWSDAVLDLLSGYGFPGNVRELKGMVERAVLLCDGGWLLPEHFTIADKSEPHASDLNLREQLQAFERGVLLDCLHKSGGNRTLAARRLGLARRTLLYRMAHLDINPSPSRAEV